jgi:hypothetical protein
MPKSSSGGAGSTHRAANPVLPEPDFQAGTTGLGVALLGCDVDVDRRGGSKALGERLGNLATEDAMGLAIDRLEGGQHDRSRIRDRGSEHLVGEDGRRESGDQCGGIGDLHWHFPCP